MEAEDMSLKKEERSATEKDPSAKVKIESSEAKMDSEEDKSKGESNESSTLPFISLSGLLKSKTTAYFLHGFTKFHRQVENIRNKFMFISLVIMQL